MEPFVLWRRLEGALVLAAGLAMFWQAGDVWPWWAAILVFFAPDLSFVTYAFGSRIGAFGYNLVHVYGFGLLLFAAGSVLALPVLMASGALWLAHAGFDRVLGYGLKSPDGFALTDLGRIGRKS